MCLWIIYFNRFLFSPLPLTFHSTPLYSFFRKNIPIYPALPAFTLIIPRLPSFTPIILVYPALPAFTLNISPLARPIHL